MFIINHRATGAIAALLVAALGALGLGETPPAECEFASPSPVATTAALVGAARFAAPGVAGSP